MTLRAIQLGMFACQWEGTGGVIEGDILPAGRCMADRTRLSKLTIMVIIFCVAGKTFFGSAPKQVIYMAGSAAHPYMIPDEWKYRSIMIEFFPRPFRGLMTCPAVSAILTIMDILCSVTGETILGSIFVYPIDMTGLASRIHV